MHVELEPNIYRTLISTKIEHNNNQRYNYLLCHVNRYAMSVYDIGAYIQRKTSDDVRERDAKTVYIDFGCSYVFECNVNQQFVDTAKISFCHWMCDIQFNLIRYKLNEKSLDVCWFISYFSMFN